MTGIPKGKFPKSAHLLKHADFQRVYQQGKRHFSGNMTVFYLRQSSASSEASSHSASEQSRTSVRVGFTVPRALGPAVDRNRIRRRLREAVRRQLPAFAGVPTGVDIVINPKRTAIKAEFDGLLQEVDKAFQVIRRNVMPRAAVQPVQEPNSV